MSLILLPNVLYRGYSVQFILQPTRYKAVCFAKEPPGTIYSKRVRVMVDKDLDRLKVRIAQWINDHPLLEAQP